MPDPQQPHSDLIGRTIAYCQARGLDWDDMDDGPAQDLRITEEVGELFRALRKADRANVLEEGADIFHATTRTLFLYGYDAQEAWESNWPPATGWTPNEITVALGRLVEALAELHTREVLRHAGRLLRLTEAVLLQHGATPEQAMDAKLRLDRGRGRGPGPVQLTCPSCRGSLVNGRCPLYSCPNGVGDAAYDPRPGLARQAG